MRLTQRTALPLFTEQGFDQVTVEDIADQVGMAASTIYRHFATKERIVLWDEHEHHGEETSCWLRVALPWAGSGFGALFIPRVGTEVLVSFVDGDPDRPLIALVEQDCVQCGLCARTCPEKVITLEPRLNLTNEAMSAVVLHQEEPAECIRCGKAFGSKGSIERIVTQLAGKHSMFQSKEAQDLIRMCDDCRIRQQAENKGNPFAFGERPLIRTTEDYLREEEEAAAGGNGKDRSAGEDGGQGKH